MRTDILINPSTNMNRQYGGFISRTDHRLPIAPCRFCNGDHWNDSCTKYKTADARKQVIKHSCYICLKFGHRAFECRVFKSCYYCGQKHHHHRSLCQKKFGAFENDNITYNPKHLLETQDKKDRHIKGTGQVILHNDVTTKNPSCQLQVVDSADDVYRPQTNMEVEFALTIQHTQSELEKYKKENGTLKQTISQLKTERENLQVTVNEHAEKLKQKEVEILQLMERIDRVESRIYSDQTGFGRPQNTTSCLGIDTPKLKNLFENIGPFNQNQTQTENAKRKSVITNSETTTCYREDACLEDDKHHIIKQDFDSMNEKLVHNWAKMLSIMTQNKIF